VPGDVIAGVLAHHRRSDLELERSASAEPGAGGYRRDTLDVLFAGRSR
jgi:hypothetical protein